MQPRENIDRLRNKLTKLPPHRVAEVEDFIDFLSQRNPDEQMVLAAQQASQTVLNNIWDNAEDSAYDAL